MLSKVGFVQVDGKWPSLPLMKLSAWHKRRGDTVGWWMPLDDYDVVYAAKVFNDTPDDAYLPPGCIRGGTGYDLKTRLEPVVEEIYPDYGLYPEWDKLDTAMGFTTRGCLRRCPWCVVPKKEGPLEVVASVSSFWDGARRRVILLDNNLTAAPMWHFRATLELLIAQRARVDFNQGLDIRLVTPEHAWLLARVRTYKRIHFAFDHVSHEAGVRKGIEMLVENGVARSRLMFYVLIGFNSTPEEDLHRVEVLRGLKVDPFVMPYSRADIYQGNFARWVNIKSVFKTIPWNTWYKNRTRNYVVGEASK